MAIYDKDEKWIRQDQKIGIRRSIKGWDSEMICYPAVININNKTYMFYSGNQVGRSGIGYAIADKKIELVDW